MRSDPRGGLLGGWQKDRDPKPEALYHPRRDPNRCSAKDDYAETALESAGLGEGAGESHFGFLGLGVDLEVHGYL